MNTSAPIVVAVGPTGAEAALEYAARDAVLVSAPLHVVHVLQIPAASAMAAGVYGDVAAEARGILDKAEQRARDLVDGRVAVTSAVLSDPGTVPTKLVQAADLGSQIVLEHRHLSRVYRLFSGSTVNGVAARAHVPVVTVPEGWQPNAHQPRITAAVQDVAGAAPVLRLGHELARRHAVPLTVLNAWWLDSGYDVIAVDDDYRHERAREFENELAPALQPLRVEFPDVSSTVEVVHAPPTEALLDASARSALLVVGRRHHLLPFGSHLGPVVRAVLDRSDCPVVVAPEEK
ncbi:universal stress protein [Nocardioides sp.]|uniref:universal stress protein n=1 Tax=Nocardioides sp. TaxID=35761 RepID=UPI002ED64344